eukprot:SAG22_NODE_4595_length_1222_cov_1.008014_2_plen_62_part_01
MLTDLSAASWYGGPSDVANGEKIEQLEIRAFGLLLEQLVARYAQRVEAFDQVRVLRARPGSV